MSTYAYDVAGNKVRERTVTNGVTYQDNHLAYDALGRLRDVADGRVHISIDYDAVGNRMHVTSHVINAMDQSQDEDRWYQYDAMNRQTVVDGINANGDIGVGQGHKITYDKNGNRTSDTYYGARVQADRVFDHTEWTSVWGVTGSDEAGNPTYGYIVQPSAAYSTQYTAVNGLTTEAYDYDSNNRLSHVSRDGVLLDTRFYDGANRVVQTGPAGALPQEYVTALNGAAGGNGSETRQSTYDQNGRLLHQKVTKSDGAAKYEVNYSQYDGAGNVVSYSMANQDGDGYTNNYTYTMARFDGYKEARVDGTSDKFDPGSTTSDYDVNGSLVSVTDSTKPENNRTFVNDAQGHVLYVNQGGHTQRQLVVDGEVLGRYGDMINPDAPQDPNTGNPSFINKADFSFGFQPINGKYPTGAPGAIAVQAGDTLESIAHSAYGDSKLWYLIAEANGLSGNSDLRVGQSLTIPNRVSTIHNDSKTFKPYDPSQVIGDTTPNLPMPQADDGGCGGFGQILMVAIAVVGAALGQFYIGGIVGAALGAAGANLVGQAAGNALGMQKGIDWGDVAMTGIAAGVTAGFAEFFPAIDGLGKIGTTMARVAAANVVTQGIGVVTGLQKQFNWTSVAASAIGAGVSASISDTSFMKGLSASDDLLTRTFGRVTTQFASGLVGATTTAVLRGGRIAVEQVAIDTFGNALGNSLAESNASSQRSAQAAEQQRLDELYGLAGPESSGFGLKVGGNTNTGVAVTAAGYEAWAADVQAGIRAEADNLKSIDFSRGDVVVGGRSFEDTLNDAYGPGRLANVSDLQSGASPFASRRPDNPMSLNNPDPHSIGGFAGRALSGAAHAVSEMGLLALDGLGAFANAERAGLSSDFEPKSQLGKLLADDNLTVGEKVKRIGLGALEGIADVVDGKPEAIGGALASLGAARLVASGSRAPIAVDDLTPAGGTSNPVLNYLATGKAQQLTYDTSAWKSYGLPSDGYFARTLNERDAFSLIMGDRVNFGGKPVDGYPGGMGFLGSAEEVRSIKTGADYAKSLDLTYQPKYLLEFQPNDPASLQNVLKAPYMEFVRGGRTASGYLEWNYPGINSNNIVNWRLRGLQ